MSVQRRVLHFGIAILNYGTCVACHGFEITTHAALTNAAWSRMLLERPTLLLDLGFSVPSDGRSPILGRQYFDFRESENRPRNQFTFEANIIELEPPYGLRLRDQHSRINGWLMSGAIREDDNPEEDNPKDDPYQSGGAFHREFNHFFDPYYNRPLTVPLIRWVYGDQPIRKAVDWALGAAESFNDSDTRDTQSTWNHFTVFDARESLFRAVTMKRRGASGYEDIPTQNATQAESTRRAYWATTFRVLGDVLHLNQDMGQPQHTRNEPHSGKRVAEYAGAGHASAFEKYIDERARQVPRRLSDGTVVTPQALTYGGYGTPAFEKYSDFWSTYQGPDSGLLGRGLADYSSNGFFTPASNYGDGTYPNPPSIAYPTESVSGLLLTRPDVTTKFLRGDVADRFTGGSNNIRLTTESVWNGRLTFSGNPTKTYSLNRANYDDMASLLIPRAVAYSAGILEHFFRGQMEIGLPDAGFYSIVDHADFAPSRSGTTTDVQSGFKGFGKIKLRLKNKTPPIRSRGGALVEQTMPSGSLIAVLKFHRNLCYDDLLTRWPLTTGDARACRSPVEEIVASDVVQNREVPPEAASNPNGTEFTFDFPREVPINAWDVVLQVVYRGRLGVENDAVVVATRDIAEPAFIGFMNTTDHVVIDGNFYRPSAVAAQQALFSNVKPGCRAGEPGSYTVADFCYNKIDGFTFTAGSSEVTIAAVGNTVIPRRRLARVALLTDALESPAISWQTNGVTCWIFLDNPFYVQPYTAEIDADNALSYGVPYRVRSLRTWNSHVCYADIGTQLTQPQTLDFTQLDDVSGDELEPLPLTISGWN